MCCWRLVDLRKNILISKAFQQLEEKNGKNKIFVGEAKHGQFIKQTLPARLPQTSSKIKLYGKRLQELVLKVTLDGISASIENLQMLFYFQLGRNNNVLCMI